MIIKKQPNYFILENVLGILSHDKESKKDKYGRTWNTIWSSLCELEKYDYKVKWKVLNTRDYGIPQNRKRVYIVGSKGKNFEWPEPVMMDKLEDYIDWNDNQKLVYKKKPNFFNKLERYNKCIFIDLNFCRENDTYVNADKWAPCLNTQNRFWCIPKNRHANYKELLLLQGFNNLKKNVTNNQLKKQIGNSMSVNVIKAIIKNILS